MTTITRKSHKKSRNGCVRCKRRHIKCDEGRPSCGYCNITEYQCSYEETPASQSETSGCTSLPSITNTMTSIENDSDTSLSSRSTLDRGFGNSPVNMLHLELLRHLINKDLALFNYDKSKFGTFNREIMDRLFTAPYLVNQILAFTALHLSVIFPTRKQEFQDHATQLQAHGLFLFRVEQPTIDVRNCLTVFLFTSIRALHVFCQRITFCRKDFGDLLADFIEIFHLHKHVLEIANQSWDFLLDSPLKQLLELESSALMQQEPLVECSELLALVESALIDSSARNTYLETINSLQVAINGSQNHPSGQSTIGPIISWLVAVPLSYIDLLAEKRPEALVILARFGALLHLHHEIWTFGDSGLYIIDSVSTYLHATWDAWLQWPKNIQQAA
ncbi:hypothetical protein N7509_008268 [Penicillium cosmopolitanum]|uniref:Zn(2)-C6 fungal-type domain-containing protein n=1 Tax=Penicillium cosmopolitanum TaxID=1131564 RepID=A0A9W9VM89_9EURO|nr:uncharacterized protein N7509_008268 [Penicillium cosmopolitanum]KAJ5385727.1 hypothetical protein N7509_008268 [Penicillium cosmopolitanum]